MKKSEEMRLKSTICESILSTAARSPFPNGEGCETRMPLSPYCHFERKREIFFVRGQAKDVRIAASGKHRAPSESEGRCFMQTALRKKKETGNEKDPSAALGMTKRGKATSHFFSFRYGSQPPPLRGTSFQRKEVECRITPYHQPSFSTSIPCRTSCFSSFLIWKNR